MKMKKIFITFLCFISFSTAFASEVCEIDYHNFCLNQDPRIQNMCPEIIGYHLKKTCVVTKAQAKKIQSACAQELNTICKVASGDSFLTNYICLTNPESWDKMNPDCLMSLVKGNPHH